MKLISEIDKYQSKEKNTKHPGKSCLQMRNDKSELKEIMEARIQ